MKKNFFVVAAIAAAAALLAGCQKENIEPVQSADKVFTASIEQTFTKTTLTADYKTNWESTDKISINGAVYAAAPKSDATKADFTPESGTAPTPTYKAIYPASLYNAGALEFPTTQTYTAGKLNAPMYAESATESLSFKNICGVLDFALKGTAKVKSISVTANEPICGAFTVTAEGVTTLTGTEKTVTLSCDDVQLDASTATHFYVYLPAGTYSSGMKITVTDSDDKTFVKTTTTNVTIARNNIYTFNWTPTFAPAHDAVQLWAGGPYWATTNIGAETETDHGYYFAWGYTEGYVRNSGNTGWVLASDGTTEKQFNTTDFPNRAATEFQDAAAAAWGSEWRLPTGAELNDLINSSYTTIEYVITGTKGIRVKGNTTGYTDKSIFLPAAGGGKESNQINAVEGGYYWSSTQYTSNYANQLQFFCPDNSADVDINYKYYGSPVRPVRSSL